MIELEPIHRETPEGSYAAGSRVRIPGRPEPGSVKVFINGLEQAEGKDYAIDGDEVVFAFPILKEKVTKFRWLIMFIGVIGSYRVNETIDIEYRQDGQVRLAGDLPVYE